MLLDIDVVLDYELVEPADLLLILQVAQMVDQRLVTDMFTVDGPMPLREIEGEEGIGRRVWTHGTGPFRAHYTATVEIDRPLPPIAGRAAAELRDLPGLVIPYLWPSRYCESDKFEAFVRREFGALQGGDKALAMAAWINANVDYRAGTSDANTTAVDTFVARQGVCRDFAHLMAALARAGGIPARLVSAYAEGLQPPDFHAVVELWLDDGWHLIDATGLSTPDRLARIAVGRDATDIAFLTIFGTARLNWQAVSVTERQA